ncbi:MAG: hypothetical protein KIT11_04525 [Fimbriimonadaceae bacterium]|nr:hypothetical protein [Fimbriimonadaceae bacterium]QYK56841.1 MAG: hypothetical protein KF733_05000 [Fimbriimonadaceae bacterium]
MADTGLFALYKLHQVDAALFEVRQRAANLDVGKEEAEQMRALQQEGASVIDEAKRLHTEQLDLELQQKSLSDKVARLNKDLFGGSVVSSKEAEAIEKEIESVKKHISDIDDRLLELYEKIPIAQEAAKEYTDRIDAIRIEAMGKQTTAKARHEEFQAQYKSIVAKRAKLAKAVPPDLLFSYERLRDKLGTGMSTITLLKECAACGMHVPERALEMVALDRVVHCEQCKRILFQLQQT